ncbi:MAG: hypothetical protein WB999_08255 [Candidatus Binataceae bacterium]
MVSVEVLQSGIADHNLHRGQRARGGAQLEDEERGKGQRYTTRGLMEYASTRVLNHKDLNLLREQECRAPVVELHEVHDPFEHCKPPAESMGLPKAQPARVIPDWSKQATVSPNYAHQNLWSSSRRAGSAALRGLPGGLSRIRFGK